MKRLLTTGSLLAALAATPALAQAFADWDVDADSYVDRTEFETGWNDAGIYDTWDANDDDTLDATEVSDATYAMMDLDGDGTVTVSEWDEWVDTRIGEAEVNLAAADWDENGDGVISRAEFNEEDVSGWYGDYDANEDDSYDLAEFGDAAFDWADVDDDDELSEDEFMFDDIGI